MKTCLEQICERIDLAKISLEKSIDHEDVYVPIVASLVYVRTLEEHCDLIPKEQYLGFQEFHNETMRPYHLEYQDVVYNLIGEGYHFPPFC